MFMGLVGEGDGNPLQYSCLENPMEGGAWETAVHGITEDRTGLSDFTFTRWRRKWQPTPVFLPGESQGRGSLVGCCLWGRTESDTTEATKRQQQQQYGVNEPWASTLPAGLVQSLKDPKSESRSCHPTLPSLGRRSCVFSWLLPLPLQTPEALASSLQPCWWHGYDQVAPQPRQSPSDHRAPVLDQPPPRTKG